MNTVEGFYITLGKTTSTAEVDDVKWRLVSLDGISRYDFSSDDNFEARYLSDAVFVQDTVVGSNVNIDANTYNYYDSAMRNGTTSRAALKDGSYFSLSSIDTSFVKERKIKQIDFWKYSSETESYEIDNSVAKLENEDNSTDKFWLLDIGEIQTFFKNTDESRQFGARNDNGYAEGYWLRTPPCGGGTGKAHLCVSGSGFVFSYYYALASYKVRAAFQLA